MHTVVSPNIDVAGAVSGQINIESAGTEVSGPNVPLTNGAYIKALAGNTGKVYVGLHSDGTVSSSTGFELSAGNMVLIQVQNLNQLKFDAATSNDKFCWLKA